VADAEGRLRRARDAAGEPLIYAGAGIIHPRIFAGAEPGVASLNRYFDRAIAEGRLYGSPMTGHWLTVGTPQAIGEAEAALSVFA
jgi:N-acetyl-alpha-D-muramate 1-phosphate uridylyltransferase